MKQQPRAQRALCVTLFSTGLFLAHPSFAQTNIPLNDLQAFKQPASNWQIAGNVIADLNRQNVITVTKGTGILVNHPGKGHGSDLYTTQEFSDLDLELDYLMAKNSNSGIYLQGRYELQLLDSWSRLSAGSGDNGGIYERWDEKRGKGNEGYDGHAPRQNVSRAPGLWQHLKIVFQAPRFDQAGRKIQNARMIRVELNDVVIHENVELQGPTRGAMENNEVFSGPLRIQGDHGAVAFRNIMVKNYDKPRPVLKNISYSVYGEKFEALPDFSAMKAEKTGTTDLLGISMNTRDNDFLIRYQATLDVAAPGEYLFDLTTGGGTGQLKINNQLVREFGSVTANKIRLEAGSYPVELIYAKTESWEQPSLTLLVSSPDVREFLISDPASQKTESVDPILVEASANRLLRSFMDIPDGKRVVHAVNAGTAQQLHYTYDLDRGMLLQVWRGGFLDATPMWHDRGDGSSRPLGARLIFGEPSFTVLPLQSAQDTWRTDTAGSGFTGRGYEVDANSNPTFIYHIGGAKVKDAFEVAENGQALKRKISIENNSGKFFARIAEGKDVVKIAGGLFVVDDKRYYVRIDEGGSDPVIRSEAGKTALLVPVQSSITYSILY